MRRKIILSLFALLVFFSVGATLGVIYINKTTSELKRLVKLYQVEELRRSLIINIKTVQSNLHTLNTPFAVELDSIVDNVLILEESSNKCSSCHHRRDLSDRIIRMQALVKDYETQLSYFMTTRANSERLQRMKENAVTTGNQLIAMTGQMSHSATTSLDEKTDSAMANISDVKLILYATIIVTMILSIMVAIRLTKSVTRPVHALLDATRMISAGEYGAMTAYKDRTEFGELAKYFNTMSAAVKEGYDKIHKEVTEHRQTADALRQSEEKFRTFFELSPTGIIIYPADSSPLNKKLKFSTFNTSFHNFFGYTREELNSKSIAEISYPDDMRKNVELSRELLEGKRTSYIMEKRYFKKDGEIIWGYINTAVLRNIEGEPSQIMTTVVDITERKKIEEERLKIKKLESLGILAGGIAHDFNNILTTIVTNIALAKMSTAFDENTNEILSGAEEACQRAKSLTNQLLTFSKGGAPVKRTVFIAKQLEDSVRFVLRGSNVSSEFGISDDLWAVEIDEGQINQVILNLIINAHQAMPEGGTIRVTAKNVYAAENSTLPVPWKDYIKISVQDRGTGIPKEHLQKIFDPYFTTKQMGNGLGLSSTYSIIKNHDGYIDVESESGSGTTFHIYIPADREHVPGPDKMKDTVLEGEGKILLMDDDENILATVSKTLMKIGYNVEVAKDGAVAINRYKQAMDSAEPYDAVLMDLTIRDGMGGKEAMEKILKIDPDVKVIVSSGYSRNTIMADYRAHGFCGVITKPYQIEALSELLNKVIAQSD